MQVNSDLAPAYWRRLNRWSTSQLPDHRMAIMRLHCRCCSRVHDIALPKDAVLKTLLATLACPRCHVTGTLTVVRGEREVG